MRKVMRLQGLRKNILIIGMVMLFMLLAGCQAQPPGSTNQVKTGAADAGTNAAKPSAPGTGELQVYAGAGLRQPVEEIGKLFKEKTGIQVVTTYGGSGQLNSQILLNKKGDVYIPGDVQELAPLKKENLIAWEKPVVYHTPALAVPKGNPVHIQNLADLAKPGVRVVLGDSKANPLGKLSDQVLEKAGLLTQVNNNVTARTATINELVVYLSLKQADAAIIGKENYPQFKDKVDLVSVLELEQTKMVVPVALLSVSQQADTARQFVDFAASDEALRIWVKYGHDVYVP